MSDIVEYWEVVAAIDYQNCSLYLLEREFNRFTHSNLHRVLILIVQQLVESTEQIGIRMVV